MEKQQNCHTPEKCQCKNTFLKHDSSVLAKFSRAKK